MSDRSWMEAEERVQYEENRAELIENAKHFDIDLRVERGDVLAIESGTLRAFYDFYQDYRSEIEEML